MPNSRSPRARPFIQAEAFGPATRPLLGNPAAVVLDGSDLSQEDRQTFARWTNLSETTFLLPPTDPTKADYKVHIHTPDRELPFAGHPTLCSTRAWLEQRNSAANNDASSSSKGFASGQPNIVTQECEIGLVQVKIEEGRRLALAAPDFIKFEPAKEDEIQELCEVLGIDRKEVLLVQWTDNGPGWVTLLLSSAEAVLKVKPVKESDFEVGLVGPYASGAELLAAKGLLDSTKAKQIAEESDTKGLSLEPAAFEVRALFNKLKDEDPTTGSLNAGIARWLIGQGLAPEKYVASQGTAIGRRGRVFVEKQGETIWIGGNTDGVITGQVTI
ncbi:unnamed protein product [Parajaminaea phylloscopi]